MVDQFAFPHGARHRVEIAAVVLVEFGVGRDVDEFAADQQIAADDLVPHLQQAFGEMAADEPGDPGDENAHVTRPGVSVRREAPGRPWRSAARS